jgi:hypothetical protein
VSEEATPAHVDAVETSLSAKGLTLATLQALAPASLSVATVQSFEDGVKVLVSTKARRRLVVSSLVDMVKVLSMELQMRPSVIEAISQVRRLLRR